MSTPIDLDKSTRRARLLKTLGGFAFPLFFVIFFPLAYVSALHNPVPNDMQLTIVGPVAVVGPVASSLDGTDQFSISETDVEDRARSDVEDRSSVGSIQVSVDPQTQELSMVVYTASGGGRAAAAAVQGAASQIASQLQVEPTMKELAPLAEEDPLGTNLLFLLTYSSLGSYLLVVILTLVFPRATFTTKLASVLGASVAIPVFVFGVMSIFVGDYGASFESIVGVLLIDALYVFTVGMLAVMLQDLVGAAALLLVMGLVVFVNLPSSGGPVPVSMLPDFWQWVHSFWFGAGALEAFRSVIYFDGNGVGRWVAQLGSWALLMTALAVIATMFKSQRASRRVSRDAPDAEHDPQTALVSAPPTGL